MFWFITGMVVGAILASNCRSWTEVLDQEYEQDPNPLEVRDRLRQAPPEQFYYEVQQQAWPEY